MKPIILAAMDDSQFTEDILKCAQKIAPDVDWVLPSHPLAKKAKVAACWYPPASLLADFPNLECLHSVGAGDDNLGSLLTSGLKIYRIVDDEQKAGMLEYVLWGVLYYQRDMDKYNQDKKLKRWNPLPQRAAKDFKIGVLGLGEIGGYVASRLALMGYQVYGWSKSPKNIDGVMSYNEEDALPELLGELDILINLLPLNSATTGLLDKAFLSLLPPQAALINCGRGAHLIEDDLIDLLSNDSLRGAILDVFSAEPLPNESHLMSMDKVFITPHIASSASCEVIVKQVSKVALYDC
jgi:glyoxylate/hydroxypyruvate reductase A